MPKYARGFGGYGLAYRGVGVRRNPAREDEHAADLFTWLRDNGILIATGERRNVPKQEYISRGYFTLKETVIDTSNGSRISFTTRITGKGQQWLMKRLLDAGVLVPVAATR